MSISFAFGGQRKCSFQWNMGFTLWSNPSVLFGQFTLACLSLLLLMFFLKIVLILRVTPIIIPPNFLLVLRIIDTIITTCLL